MIVYILVDVLIVSLGLLLFDSKMGIYLKNEKINNIVYYLLIALFLIFISAFRGDFSADYNGYEDIYDIFSSYSVVNILKRGLGSYPEIGYLLFQRFIELIFGNVIYIFLFSSILIIGVMLNEIRKFFPWMWLPVFLFVEVGGYYTAFNVVRQFMAVAIVLLGSKHIYNKEFKRFIVYVLLGALFHSTALFMIPAYFLLNMDSQKSFWFYSISLGVLVLLLPTVLTFIQKYLWSWYDVDNLLSSGYNFKNVVVPLYLGGLPIVCYWIYGKKLFESNIEKVWINGTYLYVYFSILGMVVSLASRFASFFAIFAVLSFGKMVQKFGSTRNKALVTMGTVIIISIFGWYVRADYPYYFIWQR